MDIWRLCYIVCIHVLKMCIRKTELHWSDCGFMMEEDSDFDITKKLFLLSQKQNDIQHGKQVDGWVGNKGNAVHVSRTVWFLVLLMPQNITVQMNNIVPDNTGANNTNKICSGSSPFICLLLCRDLFNDRQAFRRIDRFIWIISLERIRLFCLTNIYICVSIDIQLL